MKQLFIYRKRGEHKVTLIKAIFFALVLICSSLNISSIVWADTWLWPVPSSRSMSRGFTSGGHEGLDITGALDAPIVAAKDGTVCRVMHGDVPNVYYGGGNAVVIDHGNGLYSHYAHMNSTAVYEGQYVTAGTVIGYMGQTGNATGVHLHFAIAYNSYGEGGRIDNNPGTINYIYESDNINPVISNIQVYGVSASGYTVSCTVSDNSGIASVKFPSWTIDNGGDDLIWHEGVVDGNTAYCHINTSEHNNEINKYYCTHIYAYDYAGNSVSVSAGEIYVCTDTVAPVISNVQVSDISSTGYTVTCTVSDNIKVAKVAFPTWTAENGQDDIFPNWNYTALGTISGNTVTYRVKTSDHGGQAGCVYVTHIYAFDYADNITTANVTTDPCLDVEVPSPITNVRISDISSSGYTVTCNIDTAWGTGGIQKVAFPTWTVENDQDDIFPDWPTTALGTISGNTVTYRVNTSDHGNQTNCEYVTHIYAWDAAGNSISVNQRQYSCLRLSVADRYTVTYNANSGIGAPEAQTKIYGTDLTLSEAIPEREGYAFLGWAESAGSLEAQYQPGAVFTSNKNVTLYAVWKIIMSEPDFILPSTVIRIEESAFEGTHVTIVYIPDTCTYIGDYAFRGCDYLIQIRIPEDCSVSDYAFDGCEGVYVFGTPGSDAESYCMNHAGLTFVAE